MATPGFVLSLREKVGHDLLMLVGVTAFVEDDEGRLLMGRRADTGEWALVYGIAEPFEEPALSVRREVKEETGVDCVVSELVSVMAQHEEHVYGNSDRCQFVDVAFACRPDPSGNSEPFVGDDESLAVGWFSPEEPPRPSPRARWSASGGCAAIARVTVTRSSSWGRRPAARGERMKNSASPKRAGGSSARMNTP